MRGAWYILADSGIPMWFSRPPRPGMVPVSDDPNVVPEGNPAPPAPLPAWELEALAPKAKKRAGK